MCGIGGFVSRDAVSETKHNIILDHYNEILRHRGPDGNGKWISTNKKCSLAHTRLSIIDIEHGSQPMLSDSGNVITLNGEIYNYIELRDEIGGTFKTTSDTEVVLKAYEKWGADCVTKLRGMFAFAIWDKKLEKLFIARDRFGIKPFYFAQYNDEFFFASEVKALLPLLPEVSISLEGLKDYFSFQFYLGHKTLFNEISQLSPAHFGYIDAKTLDKKFIKYWEVEYAIDWNHTEKYFSEEIKKGLVDSVAVHLRSDVEVGAYVSGGVDSSLIASLAKDVRKDGVFHAFTGKFSVDEKYDESQYAEALAEFKNIQLHQIDITEDDFVENITDVCYHLDFPLGGPGSFPQFMVSKLVKDHMKVVLGGQGGDEIFGGYTRYLIAYFEQCVKGAIDGTMVSNEGPYIVSYESIIPNLKSLRNYKPLLQEFWSKGIFEERDARYFRLINRANTMDGIVDWNIFNGYSPFEEFKKIFWGKNIQKESYFDSMTHFDFKTLLPALLQVEDRMSMAHSVESRVPLLDHPLVELAATIPSNLKFQNGEMKRILKKVFKSNLPDQINNRKDKMGFPVPLNDWLKSGGRTKSFLMETMLSQKAKQRSYLSKDFDIETAIQDQSSFSRNIWALFNLEIWQNLFIDNHKYILKGVEK